MKITGIETIRLGEFGNLLWLHIHTDTGLVGLGETFLSPRAVEAYIHETVAPLLLGKPALQMDGHARTLQNQYLGFSGSGVEMRAASAVDIALWDLFGQATGQPLYQCLGGLSHERVRIYNTCAGYRYIRSASGQKTDNWGIDPASTSGPYEDLEAFLHRADELAHSLLEQGITAMKIWPFDFAAEASDGQFISAADSTTCWYRFEKSVTRSGERWISWRSCTRCGRRRPRRSCCAPWRRFGRSGSRIRSRWSTRTCLPACVRASACRSAPAKPSRRAARFANSCRRTR